jgi:hypothetical protein
MGAVHDLRTSETKSNVREYMKNEGEEILHQQSIISDRIDIKLE